MRMIYLMIVAATLSGCESLRPPTPSGHFEVSQPVGQVATLLFSQAQKCWGTKVTPISRGIIVNGSSSKAGGYVINAYSIHWSQGVSESPFTVIQVDPHQSATLVEVVEGDVGCSFLKGGCYKVGLTNHVKHWLDGDMQCYELDNTLVHM